MTESASAPMASADEDADGDNTDEGGDDTDADPTADEDADGDTDELISPAPADKKSAGAVGFLPTVPKTFDATNSATSALLAVAGIGAVAFVLIRKKAQNN